MKKNAVRVCAAVMAATVLCSTLGGCGLEKKSVVETVMSDEEMLNTVIEKVVNQGSSTANKEETVYVKTSANGDVSSVTVSNWLKNSGATEKLTDSTDLKDIVNVKGNEEFNVEGDKLIWNANGSDIYYQGTTDKQIPVSVNITYTLDGKEISPEEIAGKSGHVEIKFEYTNNSKQTVKIGDKDQTLYTPFVVASGMLLDGEKFSNISVTNGTVVSDGNKQVVLGMAFPGLVDDLNGEEVKESDMLEKIEDKLNIPGTVTVEADAVDFELGMTLTVVSSDVLGALGLEDVDVNGDFDEAKEKVNDFADATSQLLDGSKKLSNGAGELYDGTGKLKDGSKELANGVVEYTNGVSKVSDGVGQLSNGASKLNNGIGELSAGVGKVGEGASALSNGITSAAQGAGSLDKGIGQVDDGAQALSNGASELKDGVNTLVGQITTIKDGVESASAAAGSIAGGISQLAQATAAQTTIEDPSIAQISLSGVLSADEMAAMLAGGGLTAEAIAAATGITVEQATAIEGTILSAVTGIVDGVATNSAKQGAVMGANSAKGQINAAITTAGASGISLVDGANALSNGLSQSAATLSSDDTQAKLNKLTKGATDLANGAGSLKEGTAKLKEGSGSLVAGLGKLEEGAKELCNGTSALSTGAGALLEGSEALVEGTSKLSDGVGQLTANSSKLVDGSKELADGAVKLSDGALELFDGTKKLNDGMVKFDEEGVQKLSSVFDTNISTMSDRIKAIADLAKGYKSFSSSSLDDCAVRFIIESEGVKTK